jgi:hypothetical protein
MDEEKEPKPKKGLKGDPSQLNTQTDISKNSKKKNVFSAFVTVVALALVIGGIVLAVRLAHERNPNSLPTKNIVIGKTTITPANIKTLSEQLSKSSKQLHYSLGGSAVQVAENDLILNAALKDQAVRHTINVTQADLNSVIPQQSLVNGSKSAYDQYLKSTGQAMMTEILNENKVYESKLDNIVIAKKNLFIVGINYDAPYFNNSSNPAKLRTQATNILKTKFLPLFKKGESQSQITAQADLNYTGSNHPVYNPQIFFTGMPSFAYNYYNCTTAKPCFNDAEVGHFASIPGIVSTETKISQLTKVGQYTDVFTSKAGFIGIIQLTGQTPGAYNSWDQLTQSYKKQYAPQLAVTTEKTHASRFLATMQTGIQDIVGFGKNIGSLILPAKASADSTCNGCSCHDVTITLNAYFYNTKTGVTTSANGAWLQESRGDSVCPVSAGYYVDDSGQSGHRPNRMTTGSSGNASAADNCFTPVPYLLQRAPPTPGGFHGESFRSATVSSGGTSYSVGNATDFGNQFGPAAENNPGSDISQLWSGSTINNNGGMTVSITYNITPNTPPPTGGGSGTVACQNGSVIGSGLASNQEVDFTVQESTSSGGPNGPKLLPDGKITYSDVGSSSFSKREPGSGFYTPNEQYVFITTKVATDTVTYDSNGNKIHTWTYSSPSVSSVGPCFNADCNIDSVTGDLPGGNISAGGTVTVTATVYNDSPSGLGLPGNDIGNGIGSPSDALSIQSSPGVNGSFSLAPPGYTGPIAYPYPPPGPGDTSVTQTFTTTVSGDGTINAYAGYPGGILNLPGGVCSSDYLSVYQPPTVSVAVACDAAITGSAADPYYPGLPINVMLYADGTSAGNALNGDNPILANGPGGTYSFNVPSSLQDGQNHTIYAIAKDPQAVEDSAPQSVPMTGCEKFHLQPGANGGKLSPAPEAPTSFDGNATITVTYHNGATSTDSATYGPGPGNYPGYPGVPTAANCPPAASVGCPSYTFTKNGTTVGSGSFGSGRFIDTTYTPPAVAISPLTYVAGDTYCLNVGADPIDGYIQNDGTILSVSNHGPDTQPSCDTVTNRPFFKVYNGGASAGGAFSAKSGSCSGGGELASWNNDSGVYPTVTTGDFGASAQLNALALKDITGFASAQPPFAIQPPSYLSFANTTASTTPDAYSPKLGGAFDPTGNGYCLTDTSPPTSPPLYNGPGPYKQLGKTLNPGTNTSVFVAPTTVAPNGDVYIAGNIVYKGDNGLTGASASWNSIGDVPSFVLHAAGNIYISPNVTELDGLYIAQGKIYTCADSSGFNPMAIPNLYSGCNNQLTVYGNFVATQVNLMRTYGSLRDETPNPAVTTAAVPGATRKLDWSYAGKIPGDTCTLVTEPSAPNGSNYTGPKTADLGWEDNYLCVPPSDGTPAPVQIGYTCDTYFNGNVNGCNTPASASSLPPPGLPNCTASIGNAIAAPPWNYPSTTYAWQDNYICSNYPIRFVVSSSDPSSSTQYCTPMKEPWDTNGGDVWNKAAYVCIDAGQVGTTTPATAHVAAPCSNPGVQSSPQTCAAEVFNFSPEMYLPTLDTLPPGGVSTKWDAVTSLPPVL